MKNRKETHQKLRLIDFQEWLIDESPSLYHIQMMHGRKESGIFYLHCLSLFYLYLFLFVFLFYFFSLWTLLVNRWHGMTAGESNMKQRREERDKVTDLTSLDLSGPTMNDRKIENGTGKSDREGMNGWRSILLSDSFNRSLFSSLSLSCLSLSPNSSQQ